MMSSKKSLFDGVYPAGLTRCVCLRPTPNFSRIVRLASIHFFSARRVTLAAPLRSGRQSLVVHAPTNHQHFSKLDQPDGPLCDNQAAAAAAAAMMTLLRFKLTLLACLFLTAQFASAVTLRGQVGTNHVLREFFYVGPAANVIAYSLNNTEGTAPTKYSSFIKRDGAFLLELPDPVAWPVTDSEETATVNPSKSDVYLLKFHVRALQFDQYRVDVRPARKSGQQPVISIRPHNP